MQWPTATADSPCAVRLLRPAIAGALLLLASQAAAQFSGSASMVSDYRYRGISLSDGSPVAQLRLDYDGKSGLFAGGVASGANLKEEGRSHAQLQAYAGYAAQRSSGLSWEVGGTGTIFPHAAAYNYAEIFAGFAAANVSGRLYFSPDYLGLRTKTLYIELNGSRALAERFHLLGHIGWLHAFDRPERSEAYATSQADISIGTSADLADWKIRLTWSAARKNDEDNRLYEGRGTHAWVLSASYAF